MHSIDLIELKYPLNLHNNEQNNTYLTITHMQPNVLVIASPEYKKIDRICIQNMLTRTNASK